MKIDAITKPIRRLLKLNPCGAVIVAAGNASRMGGIDKIMAPLGGEPVIVRTVKTFQESEVIREIVIVTRKDLVDSVTELCSGFPKVVAVVAGGQERTDSVWAGILRLSKRMKLVAVHDGARPLISWRVIDRTVRAANTYSAAAPAIPVKDTIKVVRGGIVESTPERKTLQAVQTPQVFDRDLLMAALTKARKEKTAVTDDCSAVENMGMSVKIVEGEECNIKITTPADLKIAEVYLEEQA